MTLITLIRCGALLAFLAVGRVSVCAMGETLPPEPATSQKPPEATELNLLRKLFPDAQESADEPELIAHRSIPIRSIFQRRKEVFSGEFKINYTSSRIKSEGREILVLRADLSGEGINEGVVYEGEAMVLAAFSPELRFKLLDAVDLKNERFTEFWERPPFHLGPQSDALIIHNHHWNAGESFESVSMLFVDAGRFKIIADVFLYNTAGCGVSFTETPRFQVVADPTNKYPKVLVKVKLVKESDEENCEHRTRGYTRYYLGLCRWNASKGVYECASQQLNRLDRFNRKRIGLN